jgi:hypothetical protein
MEREDSLTHSQQPATCPYSEPDQSILLLEDPFYMYIYIYIFIYLYLFIYNVKLHHWLNGARCFETS